MGAWQLNIGAIGAIGASGAGRLATLVFDAPGRKVNVFSRETLAELAEVIAGLASRTDIACLVLLSGKTGNFIAGADVEAIAGVTDPALAAEGSRLGHRLFAAWEALPFPTVAAIRGTCLGGGTELALASTWRVISDHPQTRIGLPEVRIGILPGWGGSTRLPRRVGLAAALDLILTGRTLSGRGAQKIGLADALLPDARFLDAVRDFALGVLARADQPRPRAARPGLPELLAARNPFGRHFAFAQARKKTLAQSGGHYPAPLAALDAVRTGLEDGPRAGFEAEARAVGELATGAVAKNLLHVFRLTEEAKRTPGLPGAEAREVAATTVVGAGIMGGGIAYLIAQEAGLPVRLKDVAAAPLATAMAHAGELFARQVAKRRLERPAARRKMALLRPGLDFDGPGGIDRRVDLVIEAIVEKLAVKQEVFAELAKHVRPDTVLASNTSSLSIRAIGEKTPHPERVIGMHFFNPAHKMPLVEVIVPAGADPAAANTVFAFARRLGKTPVLVQDAPGFLVNRLLMFYSTEALWLLDQGHRIEDIDRAMADWGMPVGPIALADEVGVDVAFKVAHILADAFPDRLPLPGWLDRAPEAGRLGAKTGIGFHRYENGKRREPDPAIYGLLGLTPRIAQPQPDRLVQRMVLPMVNEAARCLAEGVVQSPGDLDLALILGTGFPPFRGGLCRWADQQGLASLITALERLAEEVGERFRPSAALRDFATRGGFYSQP